MDKLRKLAKKKKANDHVSWDTKNYNPEKRQAKNQKTLKERQKSSTEEQRLRQFRNECKYGPIFTCVCCKRQLFKRGVRQLKKYSDLESHLIGSGMFREYLAGYIDENETLKKVKKNLKFHLKVGRIDPALKIDGKFYLCHSCIRYFKKIEMPPLCSKNSLDYMETPDCLKLSNLEKQLIAKSLVFIKVRQLPKTRMDAMNDRVINVAIGDDDIVKNVTSLPRTEKNSGMVTVGMKRKLDLKNYHKLGMIRPEKVYKALLYLKETHPDYKDINVTEFDDWLEQYHSEDEIENMGDSGETMDTSENEDHLSSEPMDTSENEDHLSTEDTDQNETKNTMDQSGENVFNSVTCLLPEDPLGDLIGKHFEL